MNECSVVSVSGGLALSKDCLRAVWKRMQSKLHVQLSPHENDDCQ